MTEKHCCSCGEALHFLKREYLQLGQAGWLLGSLPNLAAGGLDVEIWCCPACGKLEFYRGDGEEEQEDRMAQTICPACGRSHDLDDPRCPFCGAANPNL